MKNNKKLFLFGVVFVIISIFIITLFFIMSNVKIDNIKKINIYYYDKINNTIVSENRKFEIKEKTFVEDIFKEMEVSPQNSNLKSVVPQSVSLLDYNIKNGTLSVNLSDDYNKVTDIEKVIFRVGFLWTVTDIDFIKNIKIMVDGDELLYNNNEMLLNRRNTLLNPFISPDKIKQEKIILYFANNKNKLVEESINIHFKQNKSKEIQIVEELIKGSKDKNNIKVIPSETKIRNIKTEDNICYIDLSNDFINKLPADEKQKELAIYSIVNSLTNLSNISKVQFLIDGEKINYIKGIDISNPIGYNDNIVEREK